MILQRDIFRDTLKP